MLCSSNFACYFTYCNYGNPVFPLSLASFSICECYCSESKSGFLLSALILNRTKILSNHVFTLLLSISNFGTNVLPIYSWPHRMFQQCRSEVDLITLMYSNQFLTHLSLFSITSVNAILWILMTIKFREQSTNFSGNSCEIQKLT